MRAAENRKETLLDTCLHTYTNAQGRLASGGGNVGTVHTARS